MNEDGTVADILSPAELNPLGPQKQVARFLREYLAAKSNFKGSLVLEAQSEKKFVATAPVENRGQYTAIPIIPTKAPN